MFVYDFLRLELPYPSARGRILAAVPRLASHPDAARLLVTPAAFTWGPARERDDGLLIPVEWSTHIPRPLTLEGDLELAPITDDGSHLSLAASCRPPSEGLGRRIDRAVVRRDAETAARTFLHALVAASDRLGPAPPGGISAPQRSRLCGTEDVR